MVASESLKRCAAVDTGDAASGNHHKAAKLETALDLGILDEQSVGIAAYVANTPGFHAIFKARFCDFYVNEISRDGDIAGIYKCPEPVKADVITEPSVEIDPSKVDWTSIADKCPTEMQEQIVALLSSSKDNIVEPVRISGLSDKSERSLIHGFIRENFKKLTTDTDNGDIVVSKYSRKSAYRAREPLPDNLRFVLYKENLDTQEALNIIAKLMTLKTKLFSYAGTKDRRGRTQQFITVHRVPFAKLKNVQPKLRGMSISEIHEFPKALQLGDLHGNLFTIALRDVKAASISEITMSIEGLKQGFVNYFGMQRFGTSQVKTHFIGRAVLQEKYEDACNLILGPQRDPSAGPSNNTSQKHSDDAREEWAKSKDLDKCLKMFPFRNVNERSLLTSLKKDPNNWCNALMQLSRNMRLMYVHAYQSFVWNTMASERVKMGLLPMLGDIVLNADGNATILTTEEECVHHTIYDIVLPLPGHDVLYPTNIIGQRYTEILAADGLCATIPHSQKDFKLTGDYRVVIEKCNDLQFKFVTYNDQDEPLIDESGMLQQGHDNFPSEAADIVDGHGKKYLGLIMAFKLKSSCYATMALRELMKIPLSPRYQSAIQPVKIQNN